jgi:hypothetical protein
VSRELLLEQALLRYQNRAVETASNLGRGSLPRVALDRLILDTRMTSEELREAEV